MTARQVARCGAYGILQKGDSILLVLKKKGPYRGQWDLPGGKIEFGERPDEALVREIHEEVGLVAEQMELLRVAAHHGSYLIEGEETDFHHIGIIYRVPLFKEDPEAVLEEECRWAPWRDLIGDELTPFAKQAFHSKVLR
ncbi:MAG: hypothetical protein K0S07_1606 [Chlamydiales bacterium]|jgi:mutator protein MutT|nr:hypothetical protein [Chlamydiales bacterium]